MDGLYPTAPQRYASSNSIDGLASVPTVKQRLALAVQQAEERMAAVTRAKEILDKNPELEELLDIMQRSHF